MKTITVLILQLGIAGSLVAQSQDAGHGRTSVGGSGNKTQTLNFISFIGKNFDSLSFDRNTYSIALNEEWREKGWTVRAADRSFEMMLDTGRAIKTIWLRPVNGLFRLDGYSSETTRTLIRKKHGTPTTHGDNIKSIASKESISWDRYDTPAVAIHFEYTAQDLKLRMITLMAAETAP
jgi:hypothetical protein